MPFAVLSAFLARRQASRSATRSPANGDCRFCSKWGRIFTSPRKNRVDAKAVRQVRSLLLIVGYFLPGVRHITAYLAGMSAMKYGKFAAFAYTGALLWSLTFCCWEKCWSGSGTR